MEFLRFIASLPGRLLAILLGVTGLSLFIVVNFVFRVVLNFVLACATLFGIVSTVVREFGRDLHIVPRVLIILFLLLPFSLFVVASNFLWRQVQLFLGTASDLVKSVWEGVINGFSQGLGGLSEAFAIQYSTSVFSLDFQAYTHELGESIGYPWNRMDEVDFDGFQQVNHELVDVPVAPITYDVPDLQIKAQATKDNLLSAAELSNLDRTLPEIITKASLVPAMIGEMSALKKRLDQYKILFANLDRVKNALVAEDHSLIEDQLIACNDVTTPIFFAKQYQADGKWYNVPAVGYITDKDSLIKWLNTKPTHPLNRDVIREPSLYDGKPTRYTWHELTKEQCYSQELGEAADEIRAVMAKMSAQLSESQQSPVSLGAFPGAMFGQSPPMDIQEESTDEHLNFGSKPV